MTGKANSAEKKKTKEPWIDRGDETAEGRGRVGTREVGGEGGRDRDREMDGVGLNDVHSLLNQCVVPMSYRGSPLAMRIIPTGHE